MNALKLALFTLATAVTVARAVTLDDPRQALPIQFGYAFVTKALHSELNYVFDNAIDLLLSYPVHPRGMFEWSGDLDVLRGKRLRLVITDSRYLAEFVGDKFAHRFRSPSGAVIDELPDGSLRLSILLFADRILYDEVGRPRKDAFGRYVLALAERVNGEAHAFLENAEAHVSIETNEATTNSLFRFVTAVVKSDRFDKMDPNTRGVFLDAYLKLKNRPDPVACDDVILKGMNDESGV